MFKKINRVLAQIRTALPPDVDICLVGGAVRDALLGHAPNDLDFALPGDAIQVARRVADALKAAFYPLDEERGSARVVLTQQGGSRYLLDFAALRGPNIESDLRARDFTINAMAVKVDAPQSLLDPLGGIADLDAKRIRDCSPATFRDDPVRILRAIRLAVALKAKIVLETGQQMRKSAHLLSNVSPERQRNELFRILGGPQPATSLHTLDIVGALPHVLPELAALKGVQQPSPHIYDVWQHSLHTVQELELMLDVLGTLDHSPEVGTSLTIGSAVLRLGRYREHINAHLNTELISDRPLRPLLFLAALYHDAGKPVSRGVSGIGNIHFRGHEQVSAKMVSARARSLHLSKVEISRLSHIVRHHMRPHHLVKTGKPPTRRAIYRFFRDTKAAGVDVCLLNLADVLAIYGPTLPQEVCGRYLDVIGELLEAWWEKPDENVSPPALLNGHDLINTFALQQGPQIGELLEMIREAQAAGRIQSREEGLELVKCELGADSASSYANSKIPTKFTKSKWRLLDGHTLSSCQAKSRERRERPPVGRQSQENFLYANRGFVP